ncbi:uncharacterized protein LOC121615401 isoform X1 [Chelmon rostratus]|uniref:uncharacterized protein LOC121615401 isoform X1 n=1 Tax=Chelmon rostratus TaxID=109905 RepID=UPI001BECD357|nr:uncharacterized protein LOC121615401 isoform X1 [Chelmon rostratus]
MRLNHCDALVFGKAIRLTVHPQDQSPVDPILFILSPLQPEGVRADEPTDEVCLAAGFRPKEGKMVLNMKDRQVNVSTSNAVLSRTTKSYFYAGFTSETIYSCELHNTRTDNDNVHHDAVDLPAEPRPVDLPAEPRPVHHDAVDLPAEPRPEAAKLNFFLLVMNGVRVIFIKTLAFNTILTIRAVLL